jgi:hypothetical protein
VTTDAGLRAVVCRLVTGCAARLGGATASVRWGICTPCTTVAGHHDQVKCGLCCTTSSTLWQVCKAGFVLGPAVFNGWQCRLGVPPWLVTASRIPCDSGCCCKATHTANRYLSAARLLAYCGLCSPLLSRTSQMLFTHRAPLGFDGFCQTLTHLSAQYAAWLSWLQSDGIMSTRHNCCNMPGPFVTSVV